MSDPIEELYNLKEQFEAGLPEVKDTEARLKERMEDVAIYKAANDFLKPVIQHYESTRKFEGLSPKSAPLMIAQLFYNHKEAIVAQYYQLAEKVGAIGKGYFRKIAPIIAEAHEKIGYLFGLYFRETKELLGGCKLFNDLMKDYGSLVPEKA